MNTVEHYVTEVLGVPYQVGSCKWWFVRVMADSYGHISEGTVMTRTYEEALRVGVGYKYDA